MRSRLCFPSSIAQPVVPSSVFSVAVAVLLLLPQRGVAQLRVDAAAGWCEQQDFNTALENIIAAGSRFERVVRFVQAGIASSGRPLETRVYPYAVWGPSKLIWYVRDVDYYQTLEWYAEGDERYEDGTCVDPVAALGHELFHAYQRLKDSVDICLASEINYVNMCEIQATAFENALRAQRGLCVRPTYDEYPLPTWALAGGRPCSERERGQMCPEYRSLCSTEPICCCNIRGLYPLRDSRGWHSCVRDRMFISECNLYHDTPDGISSSVNATPCGSQFADKPSCPWPE
jgi:hypothetical protein